MWYHKKFTLVQHTLLLLIEHDKNATLSAKEVKAKLDRFLIGKKKGWGQVDNKWKIKDRDNDKDKRMQALSYKLNIVTENCPTGDELSNLPLYFPCFFGNTGKNKDKYSYSFSSGPITLFLRTQEEKLLIFIEENLADFFNQTSFGARQSKGFGVFSVSQGTSKKPDSNSYGKYSFSIPLKESKNKPDEDCIINQIEESIDFKNQETIFKNIDIFWRLLRSGINIKGGFKKAGDIAGIPVIEHKDTVYCKPVLFQCLVSKGIQWDKKTLKEYFLDNGDIKMSIERRSQNFRNKIYSACGVDNGISEIYVSGLDRQKEKRQGESEKNNEMPLFFEANEPHFLWRDLLGLSTHEEWGYYGFELSKVDFINKDKQNEISRFQSPIRFHPIITGNECTVWFDCIEIPKKYLEAEFAIKKNESAIISKTLPIGNEIDGNEIRNLQFLIDWLIDNKLDYLKKYWKEKADPPKSNEHAILVQVFSTLKKVMP